MAEVTKNTHLDANNQDTFSNDKYDTFFHLNINFCCTEDIKVDHNFYIIQNTVYNLFHYTENNVCLYIRLLNISYITFHVVEYNLNNRNNCNLDRKLFFVH